MKDGNFGMEEVNEVKQIALFNKHYYCVVMSDGTEKMLPSVTTILSVVDKPFLNNWRMQTGMNAKLIMSLAADAGSRVHTAIDAAIGGKKVLLNNIMTEHSPQKLRSAHVMDSDEEFYQVKKALDFLSDLSIKSLQSEHTVYSIRHGFAGTVDLIIDIDQECSIEVGRAKITLPAGTRWILDWKTGSRSDDHKTQISAYANAVEENDWGVDVTGGLVVYTNSQTKTGLSVACVMRDEMKKEFDDFMVTKALFDIKNPKAPERINIPTELQFKI